MKNNNITTLLEKVERITRKEKLDLSSGEDLSVGVMNLISAEEHLFFSHQKTGKTEYITLLEEVRTMRRDLMRELVKDYEGEVWCISKHLLAASMRLIEVGTKYLSSGDKKKSHVFFSNAFKLYSLFWGINLKVVKLSDVERKDEEIEFIDEDGQKKGSVSLLGKLGIIIKRTLDCCRE